MSGATETSVTEAWSRRAAVTAAASASSEFADPSIATRSRWRWSSVIGCTSRLRRLVGLGGPREVVSQPLEAPGERGDLLVGPALQHAAEGVDHAPVGLLERAATVVRDAH